MYRGTTKLGGKATTQTLLGRKSTQVQHLGRKSVHTRRRAATHGTR
jgi:hypothetical protein